MARHRRRHHHRRDSHSSAHKRVPAHLGGPKRPGGASPLALGLLGAGVVAAGVLLFKKSASAALPAPAPAPAPLPSPGGIVPPRSAPSLPLTPGIKATVVAPSGLNLRTGPGTSNTSLGVLNQGDEVVVLDNIRPDGWIKVQADPHLGFAPPGTGFVCDICPELNATGVPIGESLRANPATNGAATPDNS